MTDATIITSPPPSPEYLTRRQAADYIRNVLGCPMSFSTAQKLAALGQFCEPALWWGRRPLYRREDLRAWVETRKGPTPSVLLDSPSTSRTAASSQAA